MTANPDRSPLHRLINTIGRRLKDSGTSHNAIQGAITRPVLKKWIMENAGCTGAAKCAVLLDAKKRTVSAVLLASDDSDIYSSEGKRVATTFSAEMMDEEMRGLFNTSSLVFLPLPAGGK